MPTLKDAAGAAGVSTATGKLSPEAAEQALKVIKDRGCLSNRPAKSLRQGKTMLAEDIRGLPVPDMVRGMDGCCAACDNRSAAGQLTGSLTDRGHRRIAAIPLPARGGPPRDGGYGHGGPPARPWG